MPDEKNAPATPNQLIALQCAADAEGEKLRALADEQGPASAWTDEQHAARDAQWKAWRDAAVKVHQAVSQVSNSSKTNRYELEMSVKKAARSEAH
ncbi:hypothetical protein ACH4UT_23420 [Streptomyces sp. NPDC020799]|uniref:hypothetical protein n=1 Tax=Streptomyces sp. NPDC020799 TaxID=3365091 RepID=UPI0034709F5E